MSNKQQQTHGGGNDRRVNVDIVIVGGGPATLGLLTNAVKSNRLNELVAKGEGLAVIEQGLNFGGGCLQNFGINSNTSANGFIKCLYKRREIANIVQAQQAVNSLNGQQQQQQVSSGSPNPRRFLKAGSGVSAAQANQAENQANASPVRQKLKDMTNQGLDEGDSDEDAQDEEDVYQPKRYEYVALNPFKDLYKQSPLIQMSFEFGPSCIPLSTVGMIMNFTGNHLLHFIHTVLGKRIFFPMHKVTQVQLMQNGDIVTTASRQEISIVLRKNTSLPAIGAGQTSETAAAAAQQEAGTGHCNEPPFTIVKHGEVQVTFRSKAIVLSNGGQQNLHPSFYDWFPSLKLRQEDVLMSDYVLQKQGFLETMKRIRMQNKRKIVIIGGSHSGFSTAWILANGPADILHNTHVTPTVQYVKKNTGKFEFPGAAIRSVPSCQRCCMCHYRPKKEKKGPCQCICKCYGFFRYSDWGFDYSELPSFDVGDITILYRDRIRVFYSRVHQAQTDGYQDYKQINFSNKNGFLYSFTGLRGDAKRMYKAIKNGTEKRVRLVKAATPAEQAKYIDNADLVIWACGYQTNKIPVKDIDGKFVQMSAKVPFTQFDVDQRCRIITSDNGLLMKTFGSGLAYPVRTNDGMILPESGKFNPRADSFSLYMNYVANTLLSNLLPKQRLMNKNHRTVRLGTKKTIAAQALQNGLAPGQSTAAAVRMTAGAQTNNNGWVRSGSEQTTAPRNNTLARPIQTKTGMNNATNGPGSATVNISKVQVSPTKTQSNKATSASNKTSQLQQNQNQASASTAAINAIQKQSSNAQPSSSNAQTTNFAQEATTSNVETNSPGAAGKDDINSGSSQIPGYLQTNYITQQRKNANELAHSPAPKKRNWVPSSQYAGPPINKIPKDTVKAFEQRMAAESQKQNNSNTLDSTIPENAFGSGTANLIVKAPTYIQMHLSESGKAFQAASQSFAMLQQPVGVLAANQTHQPSRYTLRTTEFQGKFPADSSISTQNAHQAAQLMQVVSMPAAPEFIKNFSAAQQSYGMTTTTQNGMIEGNKAHMKTAYSTPQKTSSMKSAGVAAGATGYAGSPLVYSQQASQLVENTPQVHKRKASFKMSKSQTTKQEEFGTFTAQSALVDKRYSPVKQPRDASQYHNQQQQLQHTSMMIQESVTCGGMNVKSLEVTPSTNVSQPVGANNMHNLLSSQANAKHLMINQVQQLQSISGSTNFQQQLQQQNFSQAGPESMLKTSNMHASLNHNSTSTPSQSMPQHLVKPASSNTYKRHPATAAKQQAGLTSSAGASSSPSKKKSAGKQVRNQGKAMAGSNLITGQAVVTGNSSQSTQNTTAMSNQKSSPNIQNNSKQSSSANSKRAGTFLKNCKSKFQQGSTTTVDHNNLKSNNNALSQSSSPEKNLSHLASAGQRQIFNSDESGSVSSANRPKINQLQEKSQEVGGRTPLGMVSDLGNPSTATQLQLQQQHQQKLQSVFINGGSSNVNSQTPKNLKQSMPNQVSQIKTVQSSQSNKRRTTMKEQQDQNQLVMQQRMSSGVNVLVPLNGNFVSSENGQQQQQPQPGNLNSESLLSPGTTLQSAPQQSSAVQQRDFIDFNDREGSAPAAGVNSYYPESQHDRKQSRLTENNFNSIGLQQDSNRMRELTLPVNKTSGFNAATHQGFSLGTSIGETTSHDKSNNLQQLSPTAAAMQHLQPSLQLQQSQSSGKRPGSRQKSASRTHRSMSKGKTGGDGDKLSKNGAASNGYGVSVSAQQSSAQVIMSSAAGQHQVHMMSATGSQLQPKPHMQPQYREQAFDNNGLFNVGTAAAGVAQGGNATAGALQQQQPQNSYMMNQNLQQQQRKSVSSYDVQSRVMPNTISQQPSNNVVPVKIFQLPVQKITQTTPGMHYMQQIIQASAPPATQHSQQPQQMAPTQPHYFNTTTQPSQTAQQVQQAIMAAQIMNSPQLGQGGAQHKKNTLSQQQQPVQLVVTHFSNSDRMQGSSHHQSLPPNQQLQSQKHNNVQLVKQAGSGTNIFHQTRNPGSPPQSISIDPAKAASMKISNQAQIAQYGLMHVAGGTQHHQASQAQHQQIKASRTQNPAMAPVGFHQTGRQHQQLGQSATHNNQSQPAVVVRKPIASQMQQQSPPQPAQQNQQQASMLFHGSQMKTTQPSSAKPVNFTPLKLQQHQKQQLMSYSHSQQIPQPGGPATHSQIAQVSAAAATKPQIINLGGPASSATHHRQQLMEISSPVTLNSKVKQKVVVDIQKPTKV